MKKAFKSTLAVAAVATAIAGVAAVPSLVSAWGDNGGLRPSYTVDEINKGAIGATQLSDGDDYKNSKNYPGTIVFNSISDSVIGDEKNFVGARECVYTETGECKTEGLNNVWNGNNITIEDGKDYLIRLYVHNNNPNGWDAVAENTKVWFDLPQNYSAKQIQVNGFISSSNATPSKYWDYVNFNSDKPFHLEYVADSAVIGNNGKFGGSKLSNSVVDKDAGGVLIGYDTDDGRVPGCYNFANYIVIKVKAVVDYEVEKKVRVVGDSDKTWKDTVEAKVGDKVEFQIQYRNISNHDQAVGIRDILPNNLRYVEGSMKLYNALNNGTVFNGTTLVNEGIRVGTYKSGANAYIRFTAEVVDNDLACGSNTLVNWGQAIVGKVTVQDYARVHLNKVCENTPNEEPKKDEETPTNLPTTGPEAVAGGVIAAGSIVTAAGYYIASRRQLR